MVGNVKNKSYKALMYLFKRERQNCPHGFADTVMSMMGLTDRQNN